MGIFKNKAMPDTPMDQVSAMKAQGYSNNQIIQTLQRDGYTSSQIFDAISQSEMSPSNSNPGQDLSMPPSSFPDPNMSMQPVQQQPVSMSPSMSASMTSEEMIEAVIDEKWNELVKDINKVIDWKQKADAQMVQMQQQMVDMKDQFDKLHQALLGKLGDYDKHILDVGSELQAMEKVFSKVLPTFIENVNELSTITSKIRDANITTKPKLKGKQASDD